ncbi:hypothetical protein FOB63_000434 [Clavispora lusitaniae]|uniref:uncharacterized protein n=1 Tax=Clavispora lusitaniae TaxID=36911 RepID=UPI0016ADB446|nr:hypothetical protein E0198_000691 [Clavispora lusitaniae]KAF7584362.1 hypothetical protein FOB63_000434 [Clavispora lusitaniae]
MSLFRSLQNSPAIISIFHNGKVPESVALYNSFEKAYHRLNDNKNQFQIDLVPKQMPTYDQFKDIYSRCVTSDSGKHVLQHCYPLLNDKMTQSKDNVVTFKSVGINNDRGVRVFSPSEYEKIHEVFDELVHEDEPEIDPSHLFRAPLVVDWDQNVIACDEEGLSALLAKYGYEDLSHLASA